MVRFKNRYITVQIKSPSKKKFTAKELSREIFVKVLEVYGEHGSALIRSGLSTSYCNELTSVAILRVRHGPHKFVTSSLPLITKIGNEVAKLQIIHVGATLRHCYLNIVRHQKSKLDLNLKRARTQEERKSLESQIMDIGGILSTVRENV